MGIHPQSLGDYVQSHGPLAGTGVQMGGSSPPQPLLRVPSPVGRGSWPPQSLIII